LCDINKIYFFFCLSALLEALRGFMTQVCRPRIVVTLLACLLIVLAGVGQVWAAKRVAVLYPDVQEPFQSVFQNILRGIDGNPQVLSLPFALSESFEFYDLNQWLNDQKVDVVIALGRQGRSAAQHIDQKRPVILGALPLAPDGFSGISLSPDPDILFHHLNELVPRAANIHVVYSNGSAWLMPFAEKAARARGLKITGYPVSDLREAVHEYRNLLQTLRGPTEALWLPLDTITADDEVVLPLVLQGSLERGFVVFSSKPSHVQRGALFSLFPDHFAMGQGLSQMAVQAVNSNALPGVIPVSQLQVAVNMRTAFHLGLRFTPRQQERFDLIFPPR
jgi:putative tryptophan/tyrosine transport system substrate-binding protein